MKKTQKTLPAQQVLEHWPIDRPRPYPGNPRANDQAVERLAGLIAEYGFRVPLVVDAEGVIVTGHTRLKAARHLGLDTVPVLVADDLSPEQARAWRVADNASAGWSDWDLDLLGVEVGDLAKLGVDLELTGLDAVLLSDLLADPQPPEAPDAQIDRADELRQAWGVEPGQLWQVGRHRVWCGKCTDAEKVAALLAGQPCDLLLTDPPYCSGGFQEAGSASGSIGTKRQGAGGTSYVPRIANDTLSSKGYQALLSSAVAALGSPPFRYVFTDWRMWRYLYDVMESTGAGVRNMIVWDKGTPGMGVGWRTQHELVMWAASAKPAFDNHLAHGNVIAAPRTGNPNHPTEKPVALVATLLATTVFCHSVADPFLGSGTTLVACEQLGRTGYGCEIDPGYVAVTLQRLADMGLEPQRLDTP